MNSQCQLNVTHRQGGLKTDWAVTENQKHFQRLFSFFPGANLQLQGLSPGNQGRLHLLCCLQECRQTFVLFAYFKQESGRNANGMERDEQRLRRERGNCELQEEGRTIPRTQFTGCIISEPRSHVSVRVRQGHSEKQIGEQARKLISQGLQGSPPSQKSRPHGRQWLGAVQVLKRDNASDPQGILSLCAGPDFQSQGSCVSLAQGRRQVYLWQKPRRGGVIAVQGRLTASVQPRQLMINAYGRLQSNLMGYFAFEITQILMQYIGQFIKRNCCSQKLLIGSSVLLQ